MIPSDQNGEAEFILFGHLAEQMAGMQVHRVLEKYPANPSCSH